MAGHLGPMLGAGLEQDVKKLLELLGFSIIRENTIYPSIDKIIRFIGDPKPIPKYDCALNKPIFSPDGIIALSIKKGSCSDADVRDIKKDVKIAKKIKDDDTLSNINEIMVITNIFVQPNRIDTLKKKNIYCWDINRLFFYSAKAKNIKQLSNKYIIKEKKIDVNFNASYLRQLTTSSTSDNMLDCKFIIFIDEHKELFVYSKDHHDSVLQKIYDEEIKNLIEEKDMKLNIQFEVHVLGKANIDLISTSYLEFSRTHIRNDKKSPSFNAETPIFQYGISPWSVILI